MFESRADNVETSNHEDRGEEEDVKSALWAEETVVSSNVGSSDLVVGEMTENFSDSESDKRGEVEEGDSLEGVTVSDWFGDTEDDG